MRYTVKEVSELSKVTVKTLHHYHEIGLLVPCGFSEAGYRLYGEEELTRLQQILFYKELEIPLRQIKELLDGNPDRLAVLAEQEQLLLARMQRMESIVGTLRATVASAKTGEPMAVQELFRGFASEAEWEEALREHDEHLSETYGYDPVEDRKEPLDVEAMNEQAREAMTFMNAMKQALVTGVKADSEAMRQSIRDHLAFMNAHGHATTPADFAAQTRFFLQDDFHLRMLEDQQTGLAYYLCAAANAYQEQI